MESWIALSERWLKLYKNYKQNIFVWSFVVGYSLVTSIWGIFEHTIFLTLPMACITAIAFTSVIWLVNRRDYCIVRAFFCQRQAKEVMLSE